MTEVIVGPILTAALAYGLLKGDLKRLKKSLNEQYDEIQTVKQNIELVDKTCQDRIVETNTNMSKTVLATLTPVAQSIQKLNAQIGL
tara:strand:- start:10752 stop:11012 length:261 start_codon:yes stop_codon:yes gene_type:complete